MLKDNNGPLHVDGHKEDLKAKPFWIVFSVLNLHCKEFLVKNEQLNKIESV